MEITYDTGAKVTLQGPATYEVESRSGGFLSLGKLTARVEKKAQRSNSQSPIPHPLFSIRTPTAMVTDLGTEFGVEVPERGDAIVHVFEGKVDCQLLADSMPVGSAQRIIAGQMARITAEKVAVEQQVDSATRFVRAIHRSTTAAVMPKLNAIAYWRFEEDVPPPKGNVNSVNVQHDVIRDWANRWNHLTYYPGLNEGNCVAYVASSDVPPKSMFRPSHSGGSKSFNSCALDPKQTSVLFHEAAMHGTQFNFNPAESFTIEGFFKTARRPIGLGHDGHRLQRLWNSSLYDQRLPACVRRRPVHIVRQGRERAFCHCGQQKLRRWPLALLRRSLCGLQKARCRSWWAMRTVLACEILLRFRPDSGSTPRRTTCSSAGRCIIQRARSRATSTA